MEMRDVEVSVEGRVVGGAAAVVVVKVDQFPLEDAEWRWVTMNVSSEVEEDLIGL